MADEAGDDATDDAERAGGGLLAVLGLPTRLRAERGTDLALRHLALLWLALALSVAGGLLAAWAAAGQGEPRGFLAHLLPWLALFAFAAAGSVLNRMVAVGFTGFKFKRYDALTFPHDVVIALRAPFVAVALIALGGIGDLVPGVEVDARIGALAFALGYFGDLAFERFRDLVRTLLGREVDSDEPERALVLGVDWPLRLLDLDRDQLPDADEDGHLADDALAVRELGIEYARDFLQLWESRDGRALVEARTEVPTDRLDRLAAVLHLARTGAPPPVAAHLVAGGAAAVDELVARDPEDLRSLVTQAAALDAEAVPTTAEIERWQRNARRLLEDG